MLVGSSPLARGPLRCEELRRSVLGLIPARAGTTARRRFQRSGTRAHPRSRGDHPLPPLLLPIGQGSSPLARGPRGMGIYGLPLLGLIPARAGTTCYEYLRWRSSRAHPRSRGDHFSKLTHCNFHVGSSPLARGPPPRNHHPQRRAGLIPARAGTTGYRHRQNRRNGAHPRSRGDHTLSYSIAKSRRGSSPLARGPHFWGGILGFDLGLIPARAGTTVRRVPRW